MAGFLAGIRVLELADEVGESCGRNLAGLGAEVIKVEPPGGERTRTIGPFLGDDPGPDRSLHFWHYNLGKRSIVLDLDGAAGQERFRELAQGADLVVESRPHGYLDQRGIGYATLAAANPALVLARISPFGDDGPWADHRGSDLVHLALGGVMMNCGYDPDPLRNYDTPPVAPQMWQAYQTAGELATIGILGALHHSAATGRGQSLHTTVHQAVAQNTELDISRWIYQRRPHYRQTARHSAPSITPAGMSMSKDGRWVSTYRTYLAMASRSGKSGFRMVVDLLDSYGMADDLTDERYDDPEVLADPATDNHILDVIARFVGKFLYERDIWKEGQGAGQTWAPVRKPEESRDDEHWRTRRSVVAVEHPELGRSFDYVGAKWYSPDVPWVCGPRAPLLGEHDAKVEPRRERPAAKIDAGAGRTTEAVLSRRGKPFALSGVRVVDLGWIVASGAAARYLAAQGAEVIRVEHLSRADSSRWTGVGVPAGGRPERETAAAPLAVAKAESPNRDGFFNELHPGKRAISLNLRDPRGRELLSELIGGANALVEGFSPGTLERMGFGRERLAEINPGLVYAAQSAMGAHGTYPPMRGFGPTAAAMSGLTEMSGLPEPYPPAGIGYSYLDLFGSYNLAMALLAGLYRQQATGEGCVIDASQVECGIYLSGTTILDHDANGREWHRYGNRSPYLPAAPHGAYRAQGEDRWIAIACFDQSAWRGFVEAIGAPEWCAAERFATLAGRLTHQDELDDLVNLVTAEFDAYVLMDRLQAAGVAAGVCQTAEDRCDNDPQLAHLDWLTELHNEEIGTWPVKAMPVAMTETPIYMGGVVDRHGPLYGQDNEYVFGEILGLGGDEMEDLAAAGVI
jgi:crotonobetainyl-CoA:carnitine CoA-transferase CaiB-like acyl-CoA transferase